MERIKIREEFNLSENELEKVVGGLDIMPMDYGSSCIFCQSDCYVGCMICSTCSSGCQTCSGYCSVWHSIPYND